MRRRNERKTWAVIAVLRCNDGRLKLSVAFGLARSTNRRRWHMSTHVVRILMAALAYTYSRRYRERCSTTVRDWKVDDLAGLRCDSLGVVALLIDYESVDRFVNPVPIAFIRPFHRGWSVWVSSP